MATAQLSPFHNFWSDVFDFTPDEGCAAAAAAGQQPHCKHWQLLPAESGLQQVMGTLPSQVQPLMHLGPVEPAEAAAQGCSQADQQAVFCTAGELNNSQQVPGGCFEFILFPPAQHAAVQQWVRRQFTAPHQAAQPGSSTCVCSAGSMGAVAGSAAAAAVHPAGTTSTDDITLDAGDVPTEPQGSSSVQPLSNTGPVAANVEHAVAAVAAGMAGLAALPDQGCQLLLLRTNEAAVPTEVLHQMATAAGWSQAQVKQLTKQLTCAAKPAATAAAKAKQQQVCCIGLEVQCSSAGQKVDLCHEAATLGALCCGSIQAAKLFRNLGTDG